MPKPKPTTGAYSARLRARRYQRQVAGSAPRSIRVGNWILTDEEGALVIINQTTEVRTILAEGGEESGSV